jgi:hydroxymethylpyrimidine pyrophosphatase-like HAD family hydrolase
MIRIISTDFDGTIHDGSGIPPELVRWVSLAQSKGAKWVINTGRELNSVVQILDSLQLGISPDFIVSIERQIHILNSGIYEDHSEWNRLCESDHRSLFMKAHRPLMRLRRWIENNFDAQVYGDPWSPLCVGATCNEDANKIHDRAHRECEQIDGLCVVRNSVWLRFGHKRYSKGTSLTEIARYLQIPKTDIFAAGDHYNDLPMLDGNHASQVAAPENAISEVKTLVSSVGGFIAERPCGLGVLDALNYFSRKVA